jgi:hypothetical protein
MRHLPRIIAPPMQDLDLPKALTDEVLSFYSFALSKVMFSAEQALPDLPYKLRLQLEIFSKRRIFLSVPMFRILCDYPTWIEQLVLHTTWFFATPGRLLLEDGLATNGLYVICRGHVEVHRPRPVNARSRAAPLRVYFSDPALAAADTHSHRGHGRVYV